MPKAPRPTAGIQTGDVIVKFDGDEVTESHDLPKIVASTPVGKDVDIVIVRKGQELTKTVKLGRLEDGEKKASLETSAAPDEDAHRKRRCKRRSAWPSRVSTTRRG